MVSPACFRLSSGHLTGEFAKLCKEEAGATAIEYSLIAALISIAIITGASFLGSQLTAEWIYVSNIVDPELGH